jgi:hypothetical protein
MYSDYAGIDAGNIRAEGGPAWDLVSAAGTPFAANLGEDGTLPRWMAEGRADPGYNFRPEIMAQLAGMQPGGFEQGFRGLFQQLGGDQWGGSTLAQYWAALDAMGAQDAPGGSGVSPEASAPVLGQPAPARSGFPGALGLGGGEEMAVEEMVGAG